MSQQKESAAGVAAERHHRVKVEAHVPIVRHNPVTEQLVVVGRRREQAEAKLDERLRASKAAHP
ncbi:hypothetical protein M1D89_01690 (plasmid) [Arthrobacter sp. D3-18]